MPSEYNTTNPNNNTQNEFQFTIGTTPKSNIEVLKSEREEYNHN